MADTLRSLLPALYHPLLPELFDTPAPLEQKATCGSCAMCPPKGAPAPSDDVTYFRPDTKCCTFEPRLPSYLVGAILADERPDMAEGRRRIRAKIAARVGVTPPWLTSSAKYDVLFDASRENAFGRSLLLLCPYYWSAGSIAKASRPCSPTPSTKSAPRAWARCAERWSPLPCPSASCLAPIWRRARSK